MITVRPLAIGFALLLGACASSPTPVYLTLAAPSVTTPVQAAQRAVVVGPVNVPELVDRPQLMLSVGPSRVEAAPGLRWAQPYKLEVARALAAHLAQLLGNPWVVPASAASPAEPFLRVAVEVLKLDMREGDSVALEVLWTVRASDSGKLLASSRSVLREAVTEPGGAALVAAQDQALIRLAAEIASALK